MKSLRLSLIVYLLGLLLTCIVSFSLYLHHQSAQRVSAIFDKSGRMLARSTEDAEHLLQGRYQVMDQMLRANLDEALLLKAQTLASHLVRRFEFGRDILVFRLLGGHQSVHQAVLGMPGLPAVPIFGQEAVRWWTQARVIQLATLDEIDEGLLGSPRRSAPAEEFYQVSSEEELILLRSPHLGSNILPLDRKTRQKMKLFQYEFSNVTVGGRHLRLVTLKAPITRMLLIFPERRRGGGSSSNSHRPPRSSLVPVDRDIVQRGLVPTVFVQYARSVADIEETLAELRADIENVRDQLLREQEQTRLRLEEDAQAALASMRTTLVLLAVAVVAAMVVGSVVIIRRGLAPIEHIARAVSQVSEKDFQLKLAPEEVPQELAPIVARLREVLALLAAAFQREKQAVADISHELRTPLAALLATIQVSLKKMRTAEEYRQTLGQCAEIGEQLRGLMERLLLLARLDAGTAIVYPQLVDVPELAEQCLNMVRPLAHDKDLHFHFERNGVSTVFTDPEKLREILNNLLHNAIQYNRPGGRVDLELRRKEGALVIEVRDTGIGIPPEARPHLFERFFRADPSRQSDVIHAGLGLAIVKGYLDLLGGTIAVESTVGQGSTFRIELPVDGSDAPRTDASS